MAFKIITSPSPIGYPVGDIFMHLHRISKHSPHRSRRPHLLVPLMVRVRHDDTEGHNHQERQQPHDKPIQEHTQHKKQHASEYYPEERRFRHTPLQRRRYLFRQHRLAYTARTANANPQVIAESHAERRQAQIRHAALIDHLEPLNIFGMTIRALVLVFPFRHDVPAFLNLKRNL